MAYRQTASAGSISGFFGGGIPGRTQFAPAALAPGQDPSAPPPPEDPNIAAFNQMVTGLQGQANPYSGDLSLQRQGTIQRGFGSQASNLNAALASRGQFGSGISRARLGGLFGTQAATLADFQTGEATRAAGFEQQRQQQILAALQGRGQYTLGQGNLELGREDLGFRREDARRAAQQRGRQISIEEQRAAYNQDPWNAFWRTIGGGAPV